MSDPTTLGSGQSVWLDDGRHSVLVTRSDDGGYHARLYRDYRETATPRRHSCKTWEGAVRWAARATGRAE